jgi:YD repeat-containing protein
MRLLITLILSIVTAFFPLGTINAQSDKEQQEQGNAYTNFLPPSPTAGELGKYGLVPRVMSSGIPSIDVPLYSFATNHIKVPISLSYHSDGIKVDQTASWVGLGWSLNAGGVITRIVKGLPDDESPLSYPDKLDVTNVQYLEYLNKVKDGEIDTEPDLFAFNFMGYSGKFVYDRNGHAQIMPHQNLVIERTIIQGAEKSEIKITTPDGMQYFFGGATATEITRRTSSGGCGKNYDLPEETAWYLAKVVHPTGETVNFYYQSYNYGYTGSISQSISKNISQDGCASGGNCPEEVLTNCKYDLDMQAVRLSGISSPSYGSIEFLSPDSRKDLPGDYELKQINIKKPDGEIFKSWNFDYTYSTNPRLFLSSVEESSPVIGSNPDGNQNLVYKFEYNDKNALPARLSFSRDHWGYYNGADNDYLFPKDNIRAYLFEGIGGDRAPNPGKTAKGILRKITYPTGGYQELNYEQNTIHKKRAAANQNLKRFELKTNGTREKGRKTVSNSVFIVQNQEVEITGGYSYDQAIEDPDFPCEEAFAKAYYSIYNETDNNYLIRNKQFTTHFTEKFNFRKNKKYTFSVTAVGQCTWAGLTFSYSKEQAYEVFENVIVGGLRISSIKNYEPLTGKEELTKYHYGSLSSLGKSSGILAVDPEYFYYSESSTKSCIDNSCIITCKNGVLHSNSANDLFGNGTGHIAYEYVTVSKDEDFTEGGIEHKFIILHNNQNQPVKGDIILGVTYTNYGWNHGLEERVRTFKMEGGTTPVILHEKINHYKQDDRYYVEVPAMVVSKQVSGNCGNEELLADCDGTDSNIYKWICKTNHKHLWSLSPFWEGWKCTGHLANNEWKLVWESPCKEGETGTIPVYYSLDNINVMQYLNISYWHYLDYSTEKIFDLNGENPFTKTTYYGYDNPAHLELTYSKTEKSKKNGEGTDISETFIRYPDDYLVSSLEVIKGKHITGVPIKKEMLVNGNQVGGQIFQYNAYGQPVTEHRYQATELKAPAAHNPADIGFTDYVPETTITYDGASKRVKQVEKNGIVSGVYLWGYNNTKPIAEVKNAAIEEVYYTSFEEDGESGEPARTGAKYYNSGSLTLRGSSIPAAVEGLKMSYWYWDGSTWIFSGEMDFSRNINSPGSKLDELRVYSEGAHMTTYTYDLLVGVTSVTDPNNITIYYEYDDFGRLKFTKNDKGQILNKIEYKYMSRQ